MYTTLTRWEIFKSLFVKHPKLVYASIAKKDTEDIVSDVRNKSKKEIDKVLYANKELSTKYNVCSGKLNKLHMEKHTTENQLSDARKDITSLTDKVRELEGTLTVYKSDIDKYISKNKELTKEIDKRSSDYNSAQLKIKILEEKLAKCIDSDATKNKKVDTKETSNKSPKKKALTKKDVIAIREAKPAEIKKLADTYGLTIDKLRDIQDKKLYKKW